ncbi:translation initiation factor eIF2 assembly protein-like isoform X2 [Apostichopus japonicus]|uniref:translation initiation factor eIF2 assembly protein-like isoform X2 n=1 Tax=Stichopus japonicus TaxID=307972 RepID=UPI003AB24137
MVGSGSSQVTAIFQFSTAMASPMSKQHILNCSFSSWYNCFQHVSIPSKIIPLEDEFVSYLLADGIYLPDSSGSGDSDDSENNVQAKRQQFPELQSLIENKIQDLGGSVFPKLNWSSPKDAAWIAAGNTLRSYNFNEIFILLKSSDFVTHDLTMPFELCENQSKDDLRYELILRKWMEINPSMEFRVFVKNDSIVGISQRETSTYYDTVASHAAEIQEEIEAFFDKFICSKFFDTSYVFDIYRREKNDIILIDFNPFGGVTDSLLCDWNELFSDGPQEENVFLYVDSPGHVQPSPYLTYGFPKEYVDLASPDAAKLVEALKMENVKQRPGQRDTET